MFHQDDKYTSDTNEITRTSIDDVEETVKLVSDEVISIYAESYSSSNRPNVALLSFEFRNANGQLTLMPDWRFNSAIAGQFAYLTNSPSEELARDKFDLKVPKEATSLTVRGKLWRKEADTFLVGQLVFHMPSAQSIATAYPSGAPIACSSADFQQTASVPPGTTSVLIKTTYQPSSTAKDVIPIAVSYFNNEGSLIPGLTDLPQNPRFGSFIALPTERGEMTQREFVVQVPPAAVSLKLCGVDWGGVHAFINGAMDITPLNDDQINISDFIKGIPDDQTLIVIDTTAPPLGHETLALRPNNLSNSYNRAGAQVIFIPFGSRQEFPAIQGDSLVQIARDEFDEMLEALIAYRNPLNSIFICSSFPSIQSVTTVHRLRTAGWLTVYEARDDMEEFNRVGYSKWYDPQLERQMLRIVDLTVSVSDALDRKLQSIYPTLQNHHVVPNAVNRSVIENTSSLRTKEAAIRRNLANTVGYVGHLTPSWFDWQLVIKAAESLPDVKFEIIGHGFPDGLTLPTNVTFLGPKTHEELPNIVETWKAGLIPFKDLPLTRSVDPNKIYEYFSWGIRCVSAPMGLVHKYPSTWVYRGLNEFINSIKQAVSTDITESELAVIESFLERSSWDDRANTMIDLFARTKRAKKGN